MKKAERAQHFFKKGQHSTPACPTNEIYLQRVVLGYLPLDQWILHQRCKIPSISGGSSPRPSALERISRESRGNAPCWSPARPSPPVVGPGGGISTRALHESFTSSSRVLHESFTSPSRVHHESIHEIQYEIRDASKRKEHMERERKGRKHASNDCDDAQVINNKT